ncbi:MAG: hypothetical protein M3092_08930 [Actinomycetia bacterium]|nr:hypothetical protein [Actinomycetes bacterium]
MQCEPDKRMLAAEAAALEENEDDLAEMLAVARFMGNLRTPGDLFTLEMSQAIDQRKNGDATNSKDYVNG